MRDEIFEANDIENTEQRYDEEKKNDYEHRFDILC
jgi:hypothetical protein